MPVSVTPLPPAWLDETARSAGCLPEFTSALPLAVRRPVNRSVTFPPTFSTALPLRVTECRQYVPAASVTLPEPLTVRSPLRASYVYLLPERPAAGLNGLGTVTHGAVIRGGGWVAAGG